MDTIDIIKKKIAEFEAKSAAKEEIKAFTTLVLSVLKTSKETFDSVTKENLATISEALKYLETEHAKLQDNVSQVTDSAKKDFENSLNEVKKLVAEVKAIEVKDGENGADGKDADEEKIVEEVLAKIPKVEEVTGETIVDKINALSLEEENKIDASHIKNFPATTVKGGGVRLLQYLADVNIQSPANNDVLKYNSTSKLWENGTGGGGGGAVDSVNGQTGVVVLDADDIDDTSTTNKFVTSADLTKLSNLSGTNTGDQTSIVGITGTKAQFDTAVTDGNFLYVGDITQYTDELAQDAVGGILTNSTFINLTYSDATPSITASLNATGTPSSSTYLRGDNTWATIGGGGDVTKVGTPVNNQIGVWTGDGTIEGTSGLTYDGSNFLLTGDLGSTGSRITKGWFTDLQVTNAISGSITGNAGTVTGFTAGVGTLTGPASSGVAVTLENTETITGAKTMTGLNSVLVSSSGLTVRNPANTFSYTITGGAIAANRILNLPLITGTDTLASLGLAQTWTATQTFTTPVLGTPTSGTLTNCTGLPIAGLVASTSTAIGVGSIELGHATDTTLARVSAGVISVEGARVITSAGTTANTILKNNGTTFVASTETYAAPGTSGNVMTSDGTNWTSAAPAGGGAWTEVANATINGVNNFTISGLTGDSVNAYMIIMKIQFTTADYISSMRVNADFASSYYSNYSGFNYISGSATQTYGGENGTGWRLGLSDNFKHHWIKILINPLKTYTMSAQIEVFSQDTGTVGDTKRFINYGQYTDTSTELTSIRFASNGGNNFVTGTEYWVLKLN